MILLIDNYDSFSYNLYQLIGEINPDIKVIRNDELSCEEIELLAPNRIILSPGPGRPKEAGICEKAVKYFERKIPILGVCLGHQSICEAYGAEISYAKELMHGKSSEIFIDNKCPVFKGLDTSIKGARYHSLCAVKASIPACLEVTGKTADGEIMAVQHKIYPVYGLQFHPESILTSRNAGYTIIKNFIS